jgi:hypothetical protein
VLHFLHIRSSLFTFPHFDQSLEEWKKINSMGLNVPTTGVTKRWPPEECYHARRPVEGWVPPLGVLKQIQSDELCESCETEPEHEDNEWDRGGRRGEGLP